MRTSISVEPELRVSQIQQFNLRNIWNKRVQDPLAFVPAEERKRGVGEEEARQRNIEFGKFATTYLKQVFQLLAPPSDNNQKSERKVVAVGYGRSYDPEGRGYDSDWLYEALVAKLSPWWIDVSDVSCRWCFQDVIRQLKAAKNLPGVVLSRYNPQVKEGEIESILHNPESIGLDLESVVVWYLCRILGALSKEASKRVLQKLGERLSSANNPDKSKVVVIINALKEDNPDVFEFHMRLLSRRVILSNMSRGAKTRVVPLWEAKYKYFKKVVTAMVVVAE